MTITVLAFEVAEILVAAVRRAADARIEARAGP